MDFKRGLDALEGLIALADETRQRDFYLMKAQLLENLDDESRFGRTREGEYQRARQIDKLNVLALHIAKISFVDLCLGMRPPAQPPAALDRPAKGQGALPEVGRFYGSGVCWAVIVGIDSYDDRVNYPFLEVCADDAEAVADRLIASGVDPARVQLLTDRGGRSIDRGQILSRLQAVADATESDDVLIFYYSGHGDTTVRDGASYLISRESRKNVLQHTAIPLAAVKEIMRSSSSRAQIMILDACHSGGAAGTKGAPPMSEAFMRHVFERAEGLAVLTSCQPGQLSYVRDEGDHSVFTYYLLQALQGAADNDQKKFVTAQDLNRYVTGEVKLWASRYAVSQTPAFHCTVAGDIIVARYR